jgi:glycosyltransferase involved in cell wall biosynthesis
MTEYQNRNSPRILMIAPLCYPPYNPEAFVNANLVLTFLHAGWQVEVLTMSIAKLFRWYPFDAGTWENVAACVNQFTEPKITLINQIAETARLFCSSGYLAIGARWARPASETAVKIITEKKIDFLMSRALPPGAHLAALIASKHTGIPWIANWNDPMPWKKLPKPYPHAKGKSTPLGFWENRFYRDVAARATWHTFPCERLRQYISDYLPAGITDKSSVVPHVALNSLRRTDVERRRRFTLLHAGSLEPPRSADVFLQGVKLFRDRTEVKREISVVFVGDRPDDVRQAAAAHGVEDLVRIEASRPYTEMPEILKSADVLVIIEAMVEEGIFLPSKFVDYVCTGQPILAVSPPAGTLNDYLREHGGGIAADGRKAAEVADAIEVLYSRWSDGTLYDHFGSSKLFPLFSEDGVLNRYREIFEKMKR